MMQQSTPAKAPVYIIKPDLDTLVAALVAGVRPQSHRLVVLTGTAPAMVLANPACLCLECGGSGQIACNNFDHHGGLALPPACVQASRVFRPRNEIVRMLVAYAAAIDSGKALTQVAGVTLGQVLGGMALLYPAPAQAFWEGLRLLQEAVALGAAPDNLEPYIHPASLWALYAAHQCAQRAALQEQVGLVQRFAFFHGTLLVLATPHAGVHGLLRSLGGQVRLALRSLRGGSRVQVSLSCDSGWQWVLSNVLEAMRRVEPGWGGPDHGTIIASPRMGSCLGQEDIVALVRQACARLRCKTQSQSDHFFPRPGIAPP